MESLIPNFEEANKQEVLKSESESTSKSKNTNPNSDQYKSTKHFMIYIIGILYLLCALRYLYASLMLLGISIVLGETLNSAMQEASLEFAQYKYMPELQIVSAINIAVFIVLFYIALKIFNGSKNSWKSGLISILLLGLSFIPTTYLLTSSMDSSIVGDLAPLETFKSYSTSMYLGAFSAYLFNILIALLLLIFKKQFYHNNKPLSKVSKIIYLIFLIPILLISSYYFMYGTWKAYNPNYEKESVSKEVGYYLYEADLKNTRWIQESKYHLYTPASSANETVRSIYGIPLRESLKNNETVLIILTQDKTTNQFNMNNYIKAEFSDLISKQIKAPIGKGGVGYFLSNPKPEIPLKIVILESTEDTLVTIMSPTLSEEEIIGFAQSLK